MTRNRARRPTHFYDTNETDDGDDSVLEPEDYLYSWLHGQYDSPQQPTDDLYDLHHDDDGTPYGAMDAEFGDWG